ncbi:hypothetical protein DFQ14_11568 [Halopolyspora algeriensis]|uniref:GPR1/FUN34/yaaH family protein n=1 Tax=Halopolyspora algeriensis TaxID=1500506 RepID=A0A368VF54_9ACTN|nr:GPR1/FUN34/YaaH family transporter [Halopolyspora algeriensis]RCW39692.1 hypothetical protein DFQ14_11568 [Halopolyspora algeriensis]TQM54015.1 hypothetical protein FHU43_2193 [Halopolyspora algeriensis]
MTRSAGTDEGEVERATRITLRPIASPLPLGFFAFAIGSAMLSLQQFDLLPAADERSLSLLLAVFVFPLQLISGIFAFLGREPVAATALNLIAFSWPATALIAVLAPPGDQTSPLTGSLNVLTAVVLALLCPPALQGKPLLGAVVLLGAARYTLNGVYEFTGSVPVQLGSAAVGGAILLMGFYGGLALILEDTQHRTVLPFPRLGEARRALQTDLVDQAASVTREAGVRRQL